MSESVEEVWQTLQQEMPELGDVGLDTSLSDSGFDSVLIIEILCAFDAAGFRVNPTPFAVNVVTSTTLRDLVVGQSNHI